MSDQPDRLHFFSWESRLSLLLPVGFETFREDPDQHSVIYADDLDADDEPGGMILAKRTPLFPDQQQAPLQFAEERAQLPGHRLIKREEILLAGLPGLVQELEIDNEQGHQVGLEAFVQFEDQLYSIHCRTLHPQADTYRPQFRQLLQTLRIIPLSEDRPASLNPDNGHLAHRHLQLSAWLPEGWTPLEEKPELLRFYGPAVAGESGYQPTFSITLAEPDDYDQDDWMEQLVQDRCAQLQGSEKYQLLEETPLHLYDLMPAHLLRYRWQPDEEHDFHLLQVFIRSGYRAFYLINAATLEPLAEEHLPLFRSMIEELRMLPSEMQ